MGAGGGSRWLWAPPFGGRSQHSCWAEPPASLMGGTIVADLLVMGEGAHHHGHQLPSDPVLTEVAGPLDGGHLASHGSPVHSCLVPEQLYQSKPKLA